MIQTIKRNIKQLALCSMTKVLGDETGQVVLPTLSGPAKGLRFRLDLGAFIEPLYFLGRYEVDVISTITQLCRTGWTVWDCGIYLGYYTNLLAKLVGPTGRVVAFEPDLRNIERTKYNLALNELGNVQFMNVAIGVGECDIDFIISNDTNSHIDGAYIGKDYEDYATRERRDDSIRVRCMSLDEAYSSSAIPPPNLIKIDIEGAEVSALPHAYRIAHELKPLIVLELHNPECDAAAWNFAQDVGYRLRSIDTGEDINRKEDVHGALLCYHRDKSPF
jgi:FkbM family methyltransferase